MWISGAKSLLPSFLCSSKTRSLASDESYEMRESLSSTKLDGDTTPAPRCTVNFTAEPRHIPHLSTQHDVDDAKSFETTISFDKET